MPWKWYDSKLIRMEDCSPSVRRFWLEVEDVDSFHFKAGQFVTFDLPLGETRRKNWRSYSIASAPDNTNILEFCIVNLDGGKATDFLFNKAEIGTKFKFKGPDGAFVLPEPIDKDLVLICTGTGVAPFRSMLWDIYNMKREHQKIHLIYGTRYANNILYKEEFEELQEKLPDFVYDVVLSREENWDGYKGYVHQVYMKEYAQHREDIKFLLCGWTNMVDEAVVNLFDKMGYERNQIQYELYG